MISDGSFIQDDKPCFYIYALTMNGRTQNGIVGCASIDDYISQVILKHENTLEAKEQDRIRHVEYLQRTNRPYFSHIPSCSRVKVRCIFYKTDALPL